MTEEIEYLPGVIDTLGRCHFFLNWVEPCGRKRSQVFFANPREYGHKVPEERTKGYAHTKRGLL